MYHIRITSTDERFEKFIIDNFRHYLMVREEADTEVSRTHTHTYCSEPIRKIQTIRNSLGEMTNRNENKVFSITDVRDKEATLRYLCKGKSIDDLPILIIQNLFCKEVPAYDEDGEFIEIQEPICVDEDIPQVFQYHTDYWLQNEKLKKEKKAKGETFLDFVIKTALEDKDKYVGANISNNEKRKRMFRLVCQKLGEKSKILDAMIIRRLCNGVHNVIDPDWFRSDFLFEAVYPEYPVEFT